MSTDTTHTPTPRTDVAKNHLRELAGMEQAEAYLLSEITTLERELAQSKAEASQAMRLLVALTPGGSEFVNNAQRCYDHVRERLISEHDNLLKVAKERNALRKDRERMDWLSRCNEYSQEARYSHEREFVGFKVYGENRCESMFYGTGYDLRDAIDTAMEGGER